MAGRSTFRARCCTEAPSHPPEGNPLHPQRDGLEAGDHHPTPTPDPSPQGEGRRRDLDNATLPRDLARYEAEITALQK